LMLEDLTGFIVTVFGLVALTKTCLV
jgi:hypothetical protein